MPARLRWTSASTIDTRGLIAELAIVTTRATGSVTLAPDIADANHEPSTASPVKESPNVAPQGITINDVADVAHLRTIWKKEVRKVLRTLTFRDGNLAPDPIAYVGYE